ncbi:C-type lectin domain family 2 member A-like isoform X2 [Suricata suricatta]|uniref:C-type lectin domain family 2 member A-like isoform X2 n=1 Tax=Suricata suricatta TaxID=37032 RepID=UPI0011556D35|nr:C-type lectin domain family 2 member A-like isoform X2 [Suricata suricatta]
MKGTQATTHNPTSPHQGRLSASRKLGDYVCKWICPGVFILFIVIIAVREVQNHSKYSQRMVCADEWIGVRKKCFYFSSDTKNWMASTRFCSAQRSELAHFDTQEDMVSN